MPVTARAVCVLAVVAVAIFCNLPSGIAFWETLQDSAHGPAFIVISGILVTAWPRQPPDTHHGWLRYGTTFLACLVIGVGIELAQSVIGGDVSARDVVTDAAGTAIGLSWSALHDADCGPTRRSGRLLVAFIGIAALLAILAPVGWMLAAYAQRNLNFPVLASFDSPLDLYFVEGQAVRIEEPPQRESALLVRLSSADNGVFLAEPVPDWSSYETLSLDLDNPDENSLTLRLRVHDRQHNQQVDDRFNRTLVIPPHTRFTWRIALAEIRRAPSRRPMDLRNIAGIGLFDPQLHAPEKLLIHRVWLE